MKLAFYSCFCTALSAGQLPRRIDALDQWCLRKLLGIKRYYHVRKDDVSVY